MKHRLGIFAIHCTCPLALVLLLSPLVFGLGQEDQASDLRFKAYNAVLGDIQFPKNDLHALILNSTLNFKCGASSGNPILLNDCGGMVFPPDQPKDIFHLLRENWPLLKKSTFDDLEAKNTATTKLRDGFITSWKHRLEGPDVPANDSDEWKSPDCAFYFSSPGFSSDRTQAIVFVFFASYMEGVPSTGDYFLVQLDDTKWAIKGRFQYFVSDGRGGEQETKSGSRNE
jgi:hypothetical protein